MVFSEILQTIKDIRTAQNTNTSGSGERLTFQITLEDVANDYENMLRLFHELPSKTPEFVSAFKKEVDDFYRIVERMARSNNGLSPEDNIKLRDIYRKTKDLKSRLDTTQKSDSKPPQWT